MPNRIDQHEDFAVDNTELNKFKSSLKMGNGMSQIIIVNAPSGVDFDACALRLKKEIEAIIELNNPNVEVVSIDGSDVYRMKTDQSKALLTEGKDSYAIDIGQHENTYTIWVTTQEGEKRLGDIPGTVMSVDAKSTTIILTPSTTSQINSWPDLWSRRAGEYAIFVD